MSSPKFSFQDFLESDKAGRCNNFQSNNNLKELAEFYDAGIRNATHHKATKTDKEDQEIVLKTGKGGKTEKTISLVEYTIYCNELFARCTILFNLLYKIIS